MRNILMLGVSSLVVVLAACSTQSKVFVYPMATSDAYLVKVVSSLKSEGFKVETKKEFPPSYLSATKVVYGLGGDTELDAERVKSTLIENGQTSVDVGAWRVENHRFTLGNIGVYLFEPGKTIDREALEREAFMDNVNSLNDYHNERCGKGDLLLTLNDNGTYRLKRSLWDAKAEDYKEELSAGFWSENEGVVTVSSEGGRAFFQKIHVVIDDSGRRLHQVQLKRRSESDEKYLDGCSFVMKADLGQ